LKGKSPPQILAKIDPPTCVKANTWRSEASTGKLSQKDFAAWKQFQILLEIYEQFSVPIMLGSVSNSTWNWFQKSVF